MSFLELAKKRCSCRNFNDQQVPEETLQYILEAGRVAPTGVNKQPQHILVIRSKEGLAKMEQVTKFYNAQTVLIICTEPDAAWTRQGDDFNIADIDATIVTSHMILAATEKDVASLWICRFWPEIARKEFHIPDNYRPVNILALGYTDDTTPKNCGSRCRKQLHTKPSNVILILFFPIKKSRSGSRLRTTPAFLFDMLNNSNGYIQQHPDDDN
mgnify:CR=1 FL=1